MSRPQRGGGGGGVLPYMGYIGMCGPKRRIATGSRRVASTYLSEGGGGGGYYRKVAAKAEGMDLQLFWS